MPGAEIDGCSDRGSAGGATGSPAVDGDKGASCGDGSDGGAMKVMTATSEGVSCCCAGGTIGGLAAGQSGAWKEARAVANAGGGGRFPAGSAVSGARSLPEASLHM
ncbi:hypothetical protein CYMTET_19913 [Cymbomonas tetramitiformis]|uniref:Uncharacterized protein n=1 Tax=Cymbomonas tetramitiformis TaxID=36881 RepID=A0AAE0L4H4_9CHLO|nr:hypothetical protein CYMTET_19913 [Cymbomonas tetramitiformis]